MGLRFVFLAFAGPAIVADVFFLELGLAVLVVRDFFALDRPSCLDALDVTSAATFPAALPIVVAAFISTPWVSWGAGFFFAIRVIL